jgi:hypothetical protein
MTLRYLLIFCAQRIAQRRGEKARIVLFSSCTMRDFSARPLQRIVGLPLPDSTAPIPLFVIAFGTVPQPQQFNQAPYLPGLRR